MERPASPSTRKDGEGGRRMTTYVYKAYDPAGHKKAGTVVVESVFDARRILRDKGLKIYFLEDLKSVKQQVRRKKRRRRTLYISGSILIALALVTSGVMVGYAGREQALGLEAYQEVGAVRGHAGTVYAKTDAEMAFAQNIYDAWSSFTPGVITGIEVQRSVMTVYVSRKISQVSDNDVEALVTSSVRALQREFGASGTTLLLVKDDVTLMEVRYSPYTRSTNIKDFR